MPRLTCRVQREFEVTVARGILTPGNTALARSVPAERGLVVMDATVDAVYGDRVRDLLASTMPGFALHVLVTAEPDKTMATVLQLCIEAQAVGLGRRDALVAIGGGVCCDVVSVAATLIRRGLPYTCVPTTLLGQIDAGIGVKGAVNFGACKNYLGSFHPPAAVLVDPDFLASVPAAELRSGVAEMLKIALLRDPAMVEALGADGPRLIESGFSEPEDVGDVLITRSIELMLEELAKDPYEQGDLRRLVDFGHTFSPVLEARSDYLLRHGEAVAVDMALSTILASELGLLSDRDLQTILTIMVDLGLPINSPLVTDDALDHSLSAAIAHRGGDLNLVVPVGVGTTRFIGSRESIPDAALSMTRLRARTFARSSQRAVVAPGPGVPAPGPVAAGLAKELSGARLAD